MGHDTGGLDPCVQPDTRAGLVDLIRANAEWLPHLTQADFAAPFDRFADARVVMLGGASHGTAEFNAARAAITRRLIERHGFTVVLIEADWTDAASIDRYVRHRPDLAHAEPPFRHFPTWMWRNLEFEHFVEWLRDWNHVRGAEHPTSVYGLDLYSSSRSSRNVLDILAGQDPQAARFVFERYDRLAARNAMPAAEAARPAGADEEREAAEVLAYLLGRVPAQGTAEQTELHLDLIGNARVIANADSMFRAIQRPGVAGWNCRTRHMFETLETVRHAKTFGTKMVVWAHNSVVGDASGTEPALREGRLSLGQLCRERFGREAVLIGLGTHGGTVACAEAWDAPMVVRDLPVARANSYEAVAHETGISRFVLDLRATAKTELLTALAEPRCERFVGVVYRPDSTAEGEYLDCVLPRQFDAYGWFDETHALTPLPSVQRRGLADTYPFRM